MVRQHLLITVLNTLKMDKVKVIDRSWVSSNLADKRANYCGAIGLVWQNLVNRA